MINNSGTTANCIVYKFDKNLNIIKNISITLGNNESGVLTDIKTDGINLYACGFVHNATYSYMPFIVKLNTNLELLASKIYNRSNIDADELFTKLLIDNGIVYAVGRIYESTELYTSAIFRFDTSLTLLNHHCYNQSNSGPYESFDNIIIVGTNTFTVGRLHNATTNRYNGVICKFDSNFNMVSNKVISLGNTSGGHQLTSTIIHKDGYLYLSGMLSDTEGRMYLIKMDLNLNIIKNVVININNKGGHINKLLIINNNLYLVGGSWDGTKNIGIIAVFDLSLNYIKHRLIQIKNSNILFDIIMGGNNSIIVSGRANDANNYYATLIIIDDKLDITNGVYGDLVVTTPAYTIVETGFVYYSTTYTKYNPTMTTVNSIPALTTGNLLTSEILL